MGSGLGLGVNEGLMGSLLQGLPWTWLLHLACGSCQEIANVGNLVLAL